MRISPGKSRILWQYRDFYQLLTASDRFFERLESLFLNTRLLSDDFLLRQARETSEYYHQCQSVDIDGISCELLDARQKQYLPRDWLSSFDGADAIIFVVPLSAYCQDQPASASLVSETYAFG